MQHWAMPASSPIFLSFLISAETLVTLKVVKNWHPWRSRGQPCCRKRVASAPESKQRHPLIQAESNGTNIMSRGIKCHLSKIVELPISFEFVRFRRISAFKPAVWYLNTADPVGLFDYPCLSPQSCSMATQWQESLALGSVY